MKKNTFFWMKKKNFFWISVVLAAIFLFFFMSRNLEGFFARQKCSGTGSTASSASCSACPTGQKKACSINNYCDCVPIPIPRPMPKAPTSVTTTPTTPPTTPACSSGHYIRGVCSAVP